jgi:hypothetical protein
MNITIQRARNGFVVHHQSDDDDTMVQTVIEERDADTEGIECFCDLLRFIDNLLGPCTSRYSEKRIRIITVPGDKRDDYDECEKCDGKGFIKNPEIKE